MKTKQFAIVVVLLAGSCKKDDGKKVDPSPTPAPTTPVPSATPPAPTPPPAAASAALPPVYAALFEQGKSWLLPAEVETEDPKGKKGAKKGTVTCTVAEARKIKDGQVAKLDCKGDVPLNGGPSLTYVGTATGLWKAEPDFADDVTKLDPKNMLIGAKPAPLAAPKGDAPVDSVQSIVAHAGGWCIHVSYLLGDATHWQLCLQDGTGVIGGQSYTNGLGQAPTSTTYFGNVPHTKVGE